MRDRYTVSHGAGKEGLLVVHAYKGSVVQYEYLLQTLLPGTVPHALPNLAARLILVPNQAQATTAHTL
ncbi:hypothetical protein BFJ68_g2678 [Fusarium oxysporum]|uniref:Uncharacterized protein n=1 Tax=Fusarium oxysporum TaxID=5507 RepID=A0A420R260_FUSOX|nr:hypothetical protein BFJ71_g564 [Fusarium oxysporum]RKL20676.1 hypothetical protein BFJ68_g2678 [Fusarium oxysporum]